MPLFEPRGLNYVASSAVNNNFIISALLFVVEARLKVQRNVCQLHLMLLCYLTAKGTFGILLASTVAGIYGYVLNYKLIKRQEIEMRSARFAIWPMLLAERDRA